MHPMPYRWWGLLILAGVACAEPTPPRRTFDVVSECREDVVIGIEVYVDGPPTWAWATVRPTGVLASVPVDTAGLYFIAVKAFFAAGWDGSWQGLSLFQTEYPIPSQYRLRNVRDKASGDLISC